MPDEFERITEGMNDPDPAIAGSLMAAQQLGTFYSVLKQFGIPDAQAEYLAKEWMLAAMDDDDR